MHLSSQVSPYSFLLLTCASGEALQICTLSGPRRRCTGTSSRVLVKLSAPQALNIRVSHYSVECGLRPGRFFSDSMEFHRRARTEFQFLADVFDRSQGSYNYATSILFDEEPSGWTLGLSMIETHSVDMVLFFLKVHFRATGLC